MNNKDYKSLALPILTLVFIFAAFFVKYKLFDETPDKAIPPYSITYSGTKGNMSFWMAGEPVTLSQWQIDSIENLKAFDRLHDSISVFSDTLVYDKTFKRFK